PESGAPRASRLVMTAEITSRPSAVVRRLYAPDLEADLRAGGDKPSRKPGFALQSEQLLRVAVGDALLVGCAHRQLVKKGASFGHGLIGMVDGKHHAVDAAKLQQQSEESRREKEAGKCVVNVLLEIGRDRPL